LQVLAQSLECFQVETADWHHRLVPLVASAPVLRAQERVVVLVEVSLLPTSHQRAVVVRFA
jgi:hypothetical protein